MAPNAAYVSKLSNMPCPPLPLSIAFALITLGVGGCARSDPAVAPAATPTASAHSPSAAASGCLSSHDGYLRARLRGAVDLDIDWRDADMQCDGGVRPDGHGERVTFEGRVPGSEHRVRFVFGMAADPKLTSAHGLPTNVTIIFEGEQKLYSTRGEDKCTIDQLSQQPALPGQPQHRRASARGFCVAPATSLSGDAALLLSRFDFAGPIFDEDSADEALHARTP